MMQTKGGMVHRAPRHKVLIRARMRAGGPQTEVCIRDVSARGMLIQADHAPARRSYVEIIVNGQAIAGRVIWAKDRRFGVATREQIDMAAVQRGARAALVAAERPRLPGTRAARADARHSFERSRRVATALQFGFLVAAGAAAATAAAVTVHGSLAGTLRAVADRLGG
jgi:Flp pilus assembly pilin Flp